MMEISYEEAKLHSKINMKAGEKKEQGMLDKDYPVLDKFIDFVIWLQKKVHKR